VARGRAERNEFRFQDGTVSIATLIARGLLLFGRLATQPGAELTRSLRRDLRHAAANALANFLRVLSSIGPCDLRVYAAMRTWSIGAGSSSKSA